VSCKNIMLLWEYGRRMAITEEDLVQRNARFAEGRVWEGLPFPGGQTLRVVGCVDSRVDPSHVLGLELGEVVVMRNIGGRITPEVLRSWRLLSKLGQPGAQAEGGPPHIVVLHHTDCGIKKLADHPEELAEFFEIPVGDLDAKCVRDPHAAVRIDVGILRQSMLPQVLVTGLVYDVDTGLVEVVVPPAG
jgi:carbonic anhydrase